MGTAIDNTQNVIINIVGHEIRTSRRNDLYIALFNNHLQISFPSFALVTKSQLLIVSFLNCC